MPNLTHPPDIDMRSSRYVQWPEIPVPSRMPLSSQLWGHLRQRPPRPWGAPRLLSTNRTTRPAVHPIRDRGHPMVPTPTPPPHPLRGPKTDQLGHPTVQHRIPLLDQVRSSLGQQRLTVVRHGTHASPNRSDAPAAGFLAEPGTTCTVEVCGGKPPGIGLPGPCGPGAKAPLPEPKLQPRSLGPPQLRPPACSSRRPRR